MRTDSNNAQNKESKIYQFGKLDLLFEASMDSEWSSTEKLKLIISIKLIENLLKLVKLILCTIKTALNYGN